MRPEEGARRRVRRRALDVDVGVQAAQARLGVGRVDRREVVRHLLVHDDEDLDALTGLALQEAVEAPFLCGRGDEDRV